MLRRFALALFALLVAPFTLIAQAMPMPDLGGTPLCVILGPLVSAVMQPFKRIPFVKNNPFLLQVIASTVLGLLPKTGPGAGATISEIIVCISATLGLAVATHRVAFKPEENRTKSAAESAGHQYERVEELERELHEIKFAPRRSPRVVASNRRR